MGDTKTRLFTRDHVIRSTLRTNHLQWPIVRREGATLIGFDLELSCAKVDVLFFFSKRSGRDEQPSEEPRSAGDGRERQRADFEGGDGIFDPVSRSDRRTWAILVRWVRVGSCHGTLPALCSPTGSPPWLLLGCRSGVGFCF